MPANIGEGPCPAIVAADNENALAQIIQAPPFSRLGDIVFVADDLRRRPQERFLLRLKEFRIVVEPAGQTQIVERVRLLANRAQVRCHGFTLAIWAALRQWARRWGGGWSR